MLHLHILKVPFSNGAVETSTCHHVWVVWVDLSFLDLVSVADVCGKQRLLSADVKLSYLTIFEPQ